MVVIIAHGDKYGVVKTVTKIVFLYRANIEPFNYVDIFS